MSCYDDQETLSEQQRRLLLHNIAACQRYKLDPSVLPPLKAMYSPKAAALEPQKGPSRKERRQAKFAAGVESKYGRKFEPVMVTAIAPFPNSVSLID